MYVTWAWYTLRTYVYADDIQHPQGIRRECHVTALLVTSRAQIIDCARDTSTMQGKCKHGSREAASQDEDLRVRTGSHDSSQRLNGVGITGEKRA